MTNRGYDLVVVANRLPVDFSVSEDGEVSWTRSPGGLVTALGPVMQGAGGVWVGWSGAPDLEHEPFDADGVWVVPIALSASDVELYYEGFCNDTLWPLYHDVIEPPTYHRPWWDAYRRVNRRFAEVAAAQAAPGGTVWVHDYQLQLVPALVRELRPDVRIGFFNHIPFPPLEIFAQLPWRSQIVNGLLGADLVGFQRASDAANFVRAVRRFTALTTRGEVITVTEPGGDRRQVRAGAFPISIDSGHFDSLAHSPEVIARSREIRAEIGSPDVMLLGVDRLDYTKGILHRIKAFGELLQDGRLRVPKVTLVQVASPSRETVGSYMQLREDVELLVGRINGEYGHLGCQPIRYLHHSYPPEEMAALYLAADVMLVTALRDGMNLVAKEYVAARWDMRGVLVLSEFTGAADELAGSVSVNPHDIDGMKDSIVSAVEMDHRDQRKRMRRLRRRVMLDDVQKWSQSFLAVLAAVPQPPAGCLTTGPGPTDELRTALARLARDTTRRPLLVALDFDGTLAPLVNDPEDSRMLPSAAVALALIAGVPDVTLALVSGRSVVDLHRRAMAPVGTVLIGSHGAERGRVGPYGLELDPLRLDPEQTDLLTRVGAGLTAAARGRDGVWVQHKPAAVVLHTRMAGVVETEAANAQALALANSLGVDALHGKDVVEMAVLSVTKGHALAKLRDELGARVIVYAGDDTTDEQAFAELAATDLSVKVGAGDTVARLRAEDPGSFCEELAAFASALIR